MSFTSFPTLKRKREVEAMIRHALERVLLLRFGRASDPVCRHLDNILAKCAHEISKFATVALVDADAEEIQVYIKGQYYLLKDIGLGEVSAILLRANVEFWVAQVQDSIFTIFTNPLPPERIPKFELLF